MKITMFRDRYNYNYSRNRTPRVAEVNHNYVLLVGCSSRNGTGQAMARNVQSSAGFPFHCVPSTSSTLPPISSRLQATTSEAFQCPPMQSPNPSSVLPSQRVQRPKWMNERQSIFGKRGAKKSKKAKLSMWEHEFVCLAQRGELTPPTPMEKANLIMAGLGPRKLCII